MCVVLANLKAKKLAGYESHGMVLCGETADRTKIEVICPPEGSQPGDKVYFEGEERNPPEQLNPKKNPWERVQPDLKVDASGVCCWNDKPFKTDKGVCTVGSVTNGIIN